MEKDKLQLDRKAKQKELLRALIEEESRYKIDVLDNSMLPENMKNKKKVEFVFKPPVVNTLSQAALHLIDMPEDLLEGKVSLTKAAPYTENIVKALCCLSWAKKEPYPEWYEEFLLLNVKPGDLFNLFKEVSLKMKTDFFLASFPIAYQNPMILQKPKSAENTASIPTN